MATRPKVTVRGNKLVIEVRLGDRRSSAHDRRTLRASTHGFQFVGKTRTGKALGLQLAVSEG